uniref:Uncharacterized protein n=1 Tax=Papilio xuthus TaxID=66420 RepID=I4DLN3_PAPXU|nr:unknown unsecreted protein [Papilio xuthus]
MRCLPLIDGGEDAQTEKKSPSMHPLILKVHFLSFPYKKKSGKRKRTILGLRDAHSSDCSWNSFHLRRVFCVVVVFHRMSRADSFEDVKARSTTVSFWFTIELTHIYCF